MTRLYLVCPCCHRALARGDFPFYVPANVRMAAD